MRVDSLSVQMRPRAPHEAADLGIRLCQANWREVYRCYLVVAIPMALLSLSLFEIRPWLPIFFLWCAKPWLDRTVLFVLSRAAFGQRTTVGDLWAEQRRVWWHQFLLTWTWRRLSPWRSLTQPVYQLEGHSFFKLRPRILQIRRKHSGAATMVTSAFSMTEEGLVLSLTSLVWWLDPLPNSMSWSELFSGEWSWFFGVASSIAYAIAVLFLEPFYVAAGFGMYLNRRAELEAWDIEQEFRRAFAS